MFAWFRCMLGCVIVRLTILNMTLMGLSYGTQWVEANPRVEWVWVPNTSHPYTPTPDTCSGSRLVIPRRALIYGCWCPFLWIRIQKPIWRKAQWKARPKGLPRRPKSKRGPKKEVQGKGICSRIQICRRIQFFGRMASVDKDKLGPRPFWFSQHYLAHKGPNPFV